MKIKATGVYMPPLTMPEVPKMLSVKVSINLEVLKKLPVISKINNLAKVPSGKYTPHLHNHYLCTLIDSMEVDKMNKTQRQLQRIEHEGRVMDLRIAGHTYRVIGHEVALIEGRDKPYTRQAMHKTVNKKIKEAKDQANEKIEELRLLEAMRLDYLMIGPYKQATEEGNLQAVDRVLKIMDRRAKLLGLDVPSKITQVDESNELQNRIVMYVPDNGRGPDSITFKKRNNDI